MSRPHLQYDSARVEPDSLTESFLLDPLYTLQHSKVEDVMGWRLQDAEKPFNDST